MSAREDAATKSLRLLVAGRLNITRRVADEIEAEVRGDSGEMYSVGHRLGAWWCSCPASGRCSHLISLQRVVVLRSQWRQVEDAWPPNDETSP